MSIFTKIKNLFTLEVRVSELEKYTFTGTDPKAIFTQQLTDVLREVTESVNRPVLVTEDEEQESDEDKLNSDYFEEKAENLSNDSYEKFAPQDYTDLNDKIAALESEIENLLEDNQTLSRKAIELKNREITTKEAMDKLRKELMEDKRPGSYYQSWQDSIATAFFAECRKSKNKVKVSTKNLHEIANIAAKNFLDLVGK